MRYISSGVWYCLRVAYIEAFLIKRFELGVFFLAHIAHDTFNQ
jgi:hypothetical protein